MKPLSQWTHGEIIDALKRKAESFDHYAWFNDGKDGLMIQCKKKAHGFEWTTINANNIVSRSSEKACLRILKDMCVTDHTSHNFIEA